MATLCRERGLLFIHGRRTGSTAVRDVLHERFGGEELPPERILDERGHTAAARHSNLPTLIREGLITPEQRRQLLVFTAVRNPFDDLVSTYIKNAQVYEGSLARPGQIMGDTRVAQLRYCATHRFDEWIAWRYTRSGLLGRFKEQPVGTYAHTEGADVVMRFERLQEDFDALLRRIGYEGTIELPRVNVTADRRDFREYYTPQARRIVERAWARELERYGYAFDDGAAT